MSRKKQLAEIARLEAYRAARFFGAMGGRAGRGKRKARTHEQASRAAKKRWQNFYDKQNEFPH